VEANGAGDWSDDVTFTAGQKLAASDLDQIVSSVCQILGAAQTTASITMGAGAVDLTGATLTFTTQYANTKALIWGTFDVGIATGTHTFVGTCVVDGTTLTTGEAHSTGVRETTFQQWIPTLSAAGSHTIKLQGAESSGTAITFSIHTKLHVLVLGP
jgi:hypothetical protein